MDNLITRAEHEEFRRPIEEENKRQDRRLELLEHTVQQISDLTTSVEKLAVSMEGMLREQEKQGTRLETLEDRDGEMWRKIIGYAATAAVGIVIGYVARQIGLSSERKATYELEGTNQEPGVLGAGTYRRAGDCAGVQRSDRCGYDHVGRTVGRYYRRVQQSVLPVPRGVERVECAE